VEEYIRLLDLPDEFDFAILKKAYRKKVLIFHPDKAQNEAQRAEFETMMKKLNAANDYLKEYLERHDGKYTKSVEEDTSYSEDYSETNNYEDNNYTDESSQQEEQQEEQEEYEEYEETQEDNNLNNLSFLEQILYGFKLMLNPKLLHEALKQSNTNIFAPVFESPKNTIASIILFFLIFYPGCKFIDKYIFPDTDNNSQQQEIVQETQESKEPPAQESQEEPQQEPNKTIILDDTTEIGRYMRNVQRRIKLNWDLPRNILTEKGYDEVKVVVRFTVAKDGQLIGEPKIKQTSGLDIVDSRSLEAVKLAAPFQPLPEDVKNDSLVMEFTLEANRK